MSASQCDRCGRPRPDASSTSDEETARTIPYPPFVGADGPWAAFDGRDVCPTCQTTEERRQAAHRVADMIEREVARRQALSYPPDVYESGWVAYAMALRAGGDAPRYDGDPTSGEPAAPPTHDPQESSASAGAVHEPQAEAVPPSLRVAFTGAFLTDPPLAVRIDSYSEIQTELSNLLAWPQWTTKALRAREGTYLGEGGGGFTEALPLIIIRRQGFDLLPQLTAALTSVGCAPGGALSRFSPIAEARPMTLGIDFYDLGVAVITAWFHVTAKAGADYIETAEAIKKLAALRGDGCDKSPLAEALQDIATATAAQYGVAIRSAAPEASQANWLSAGNVTSDGSNAGPPQDDGKLLWLHPVNVVCPKEVKDCADRVKELRPPFRKQIRVNGGVFAAGIGSSVVVVNPGSKVRSELAPVRLTELHWAYYALYMQFDRGLLQVLNRDRRTEHKRVWEFEADADNIFGDYLRVMDARARLDTDLISRGGDDMAIWNAISGVQRFEEIVAAVDTKLEVLGKLAERRVEQATETRNFQITLALGSLAMLTLVTLTLSFWGSWSPTKTYPATELWGIPVWHFRLWSGITILASTASLSWFVIRRYLHRQKKKGHGVS